MKDCFKLDLAKPTEGWIQIAPMLSGRYNFALVTANGLIYAVGGQDLNSEVNNIEVSYLMHTIFLNFYFVIFFIKVACGCTHTTWFQVGTYKNSHIFFECFKYFKAALHRIFVSCLDS